MIGKAARGHVGLTPKGILAGHRERTAWRMRGAGTVLLIQDGTDLSFAMHGGCSGLGVISRNQGGVISVWRNVNFLMR